MIQQRNQPVHASDMRFLMQAARPVGHLQIPRIQLLQPGYRQSINQRRLQYLNRFRLIPFPNAIETA